MCEYCLPEVVKFDFFSDLLDALQCMAASVVVFFVFYCVFASLNSTPPLLGL